MSTRKDSDLGVLTSRTIESEAFKRIREKCVEVGLIDIAATPIDVVVALVLDLAFGNVSLEDVIRAQHAVATAPTAMDAERERLRKLTPMVQGMQNSTEYIGDATLRFSCTDGCIREIMIPSGSRITVHTY